MAGSTTAVTTYINYESALGVRYDTVAGWAKQFMATGLAMLTDKPRSGRLLALTGLEPAALTALACSPAPDGRRQWSRRLLAGKAVELGHCERMSARCIVPG